MQPLEESTIQPSYSRKWLWAPALVGFALILYNIWWTARTSAGDETAVPGVLSDVGVTLLLFSVLFWFERRIERRILEGVQVLTDQDREQYEQEEDPLAVGDFLADDGPQSTAIAFVGFIEEGNHDAIWLLSDPNLRRCRAQAWVYNNLDDLGLEKSEVDAWEEVAAQLEGGPTPDSPRWNAFAESEMRQLREAFAGFELNKVGWSSRRRVVGPRHEVVLMHPLPKGAPHGYRVTSPTLLDDSRSILLLWREHSTAPNGRVYQVAGLGRTAPLEGWPPTWWATGDSVAESTHPGVEAERPPPGSLS